MSILDDKSFAVERAVIDGLIRFEKAEPVVCDERAVIVWINGDEGYRALFRDDADLNDYAARYGVSGTVCVMNCGRDIAKRFDCSALYRTFAYTADMPPSGFDPGIKRLAPSLAETVYERYHNPGGGYRVGDIAELLRRGNIFGAIEDGKLTGFIGLHFDGSMGMLEVFEPFRRRGIGERLERFLITYVMTVGRVPTCEVDADNVASLRLQERIGLTPGAGYTVWLHI